MPFRRSTTVTSAAPVFNAGAVQVPPPPPIEPAGSPATAPAAPAGEPIAIQPDQKPATTTQPLHAAPTSDKEPTMTTTPAPAAPPTPPPAIAAVSPPKRRWLYNPSSTYLAAFDCDAVADDGRPTSRWFDLARRENSQIIEVDDATAQRVLAGGHLDLAG
ncbi:MAG: hypothetical protein LW860_12485 [Xanthomonadaceae bacterium]|jgi:hypothetical protein|nr:hypothetical protein [Xanthomonadaceae bacterium]